MVAASCPGYIRRVGLPIGGDLHQCRSGAVSAAVASGTLAGQVTAAEAHAMSDMGWRSSLAAMVAACLDAPRAFWPDWCSWVLGIRTIWPGDDQTRRCLREATAEGAQSPLPCQATEWRRAWQGGGSFGWINGIVSLVLALAQPAGAGALVSAGTSQWSPVLCACGRRPDQESGVDRPLWSTGHACGDHNVAQPSPTEPAHGCSAEQPGQILAVLVPLAPAMVRSGGAQRGTAAPLRRRYQAGTLIIEVTTIADQGKGQWHLSGSVWIGDPSIADPLADVVGRVAQLTGPDVMPLTAPIDDLGSFSLAGLATGHYRLEIILLERTIVIERLMIS